jgi:hypothetical protein
VRTATGNQTVASSGITASCVGTEKVLGGGGSAEAGANNSRMNSSAPVYVTVTNPTGWRVEWHGTGGGAPDAGNYTVYAICAA